MSRPSPSKTAPQGANQWSVLVDDLTFAWPDHTPVFDRFSLHLGPGRTGLVGNNGTGKSTLLRLICGDLRASSGTVRVSGELGWLPQNLGLHGDLPVEEVLEIAARRRALHAIEAGETTEENFALIGDDWDIEERAHATLGQLGLGHIDLDRTMSEVSGGEGVLLRLAALLLRRPDVLLLDEPTNNLDLDARARLYEAVEAWRGVLLVVSHDRELLERVDQIAELREGEARLFGGNFTAYEEAVATEQAAAERTVRVAEGDLKRQKRELLEGSGEVGQARACRQEGTGQQARAEDRHGPAETRGPGLGGQTPHHARTEAGRGKGPPGRSRNARP